MDDVRKPIVGMKGSGKSSKHIQVLRRSPETQVGATLLPSYPVIMRIITDAGP